MARPKKEGPMKVMLTLRVPADLKEELDRLATENDRTLSAQVVRMLRESLERLRNKKQARDE